jgi:hypothetical protein
VVTVSKGAALVLQIDSGVVVVPVAAIGREDDGAVVQGKCSERRYRKHDDQGRAMQHALRSPLAMCYVLHSHGR